MTFYIVVMGGLSDRRQALTVNGVAEFGWTYTPDLGLKFFDTSSALRVARAVLGVQEWEVKRVDA